MAFSSMVEKEIELIIADGVSFCPGSFVMAMAASTKNLMSLFSVIASMFISTSLLPMNNHHNILYFLITIYTIYSKKCIKHSVNIGKHAIL